MLARLDVGVLAAQRLDLGVGRGVATGGDRAGEQGEDGQRDGAEG